MNATVQLQSADFAGDEAMLSVNAFHLAAPGLVVNQAANELELLSGAIHRLENALDLFGLILEQTSGHPSLSGAVTVIGRLCTEAHAMNQVCLRHLEHGPRVGT